jgi:hypothetical protein
LTVSSRSFLVRVVKIRQHASNFFWEQGIYRPVFFRKISLKPALAIAALNWVLNNVSEAPSISISGFHIEDLGIIVRTEAARNKLREQVGGSDVGMIMSVPDPAWWFVSNNSFCRTPYESKGLEFDDVQFTPLLEPTYYD